MSNGQIEPHNNEIEMACLGSILVKDVEMFEKINAILKPHHFYQEKNKIIYEEMISLYKVQGEVDEILLIDNLNKKELLKKCEGAYYITGLKDTSPTMSRGESYAIRIRDYYYEREKIKVGHQLLNGNDIKIDDILKVFKPTIKNNPIINNNKSMEFYDIVKDREEKPLDFIEGYLPVEAIAMDVGKQGIGKTIFNLNKAICLSAGVSSWFGLKIPKALKVLYFIAEGGYHSVNSRIKTMAKNKAIKPHKEFLEIIPIRPIVITSSSDFQEIESKIDEYSPDVIFFDPLVKIHNSDENSNNEMEMVMNQFRKLITGKNRSIIIIHHINKIGQSRGASAIEGDVDSSLQLSWVNMSKGIIKVGFTKMRHQEIPHPFNIELNQSTLTFNRSNKKSSNDNRIIELVKNAGFEGILAKELVDKLVTDCSVGSKTPYRWIRHLTTAGILRTDGKLNQKRLWLNDSN